MPDLLLTGLLLAAVAAAAAATRVPWRRLLRRLPVIHRAPLPARRGRSGRTAGPVRIAWEATGSGPPLLLVHGLGYGRWGWEPIVERLAGRFEVVTVDNRGIGGGGAPPPPGPTPGGGGGPGRGGGDARAGRGRGGGGSPGGGGGPGAGP